VGFKSDWRRGPGVLLAVAPLLVVAGCGGGSGTAAGGPGEAPAQAPEPITLYTCVTDTTVQPVLAAFEERHPGQEVDLFRAPTGELNARVAADARSGGLRADVVWGCDPLTMQSWVEQGLVGGWTPPEADAIPAQYRTGDYAGAHLLYMVAVHREDAPPPTTWQDLTGSDYAGAVAVPDPSVAASALGALGYFSQDPGYGVDFYRDLRSNGAVQVKTPDEVTTGVAQGLYRAGMTIANSAEAAKADGSPVDVAWPRPGAVAVHGPIALATASAESQAAKDLISYVLSEDGQAVVGAAGSYPVLPGVPGPVVPEDAPVVVPDWAAVEGSRDALLSEHQQVFGG
jgi:iron(III) transport system substrate-binding protein